MSQRICRTAALAVGLALAHLGAFAPAAGAATFSNSTSMTIPTSQGNASLYPSPITVSGMPGVVTDLNVSLNGYSHSFPDDVGVVLVGPSGEALLLMDGAGDEANATSANLTFDDDAAAPLADIAAPTSGTWKPTNYYSFDPFPAPGPDLAYNEPGPASGGTATLASSFYGVHANGTWKLFVRDFVQGDGGSIEGGWSLTVLSGAAVQPSAPSLAFTEPEPPADHNNPKIFGSSGPGTVVEIHASAGCGGGVVTKGTAAQLAYIGLEVLVPDNSTTQFSATASNDAGTSPCSAAVSYTESTPTQKTTPLTPPLTSPFVPPPAPVEAKIDRAKIDGAKAKARFDFSATGGSGALSFECRLDKKPFKACSSPRRYSRLAPGKHRFQVRARDSNGSIDPAPASRSFRIPQPD